MNNIQRNIFFSIFVVLLTITCLRAQTIPMRIIAWQQSAKRLIESSEFVCYDTLLHLKDSISGQRIVKYFNNNTIVELESWSFEGQLIYKHIFSKKSEFELQSTFCSDGNLSDEAIIYKGMRSGLYANYNCVTNHFEVGSVVNGIRVGWWMKMRKGKVLSTHDYGKLDLLDSLPDLGNLVEPVGVR